MFFRTSQVLTLVALLASFVTNVRPDIIDKPKVLVGPVAFSQATNCTFTLESEGNVSANSTYSVSTDKPSWFTGFPSSVVIPAGQHSVSFTAYYVGGQEGAASFSAWNGSGSVGALIPSTGRTIVRLK